MRTLQGKFLECKIKEIKKQKKKFKLCLFNLKKYVRISRTFKKGIPLLLLLPKNIGIDEMNIA